MEMKRTKFPAQPRQTRVDERQAPPVAKGTSAYGSVLVPESGFVEASTRSPAASAELVRNAFAITAVGLAAAFCLLWFVSPAYAEIYEAVGASPPLFTRTVLALGALARTPIGVLLGCSAVAWCVWSSYRCEREAGYGEALAAILEDQSSHGFVRRHLARTLCSYPRMYLLWGGITVALMAATYYPLWQLAGSGR